MTTTSTTAAPATHATNTEPLASDAAAKPESFVDEVFDLLTARASHALAAVARWLEERAKAASGLAAKLDHSRR